MSAVSPFSPHQRTCAERNGTSVSCQRRKCRLLCPPSQQGFNGYRIAASVCWTSKNALGTEKGAQVAGQPELVHAVAVRANMRSILVAMMKSFSCSPLIFLVCRETVALPQPKLIFG